MIPLPPRVPIPEGTPVVQHVALGVPLHVDTLLRHADMYRPYAWVEEMPTETREQHRATAVAFVNIMVANGKIPPMTDAGREEWVNGWVDQTRGQRVVRVCRVGNELGHAALSTLFQRVRDHIVSEYGDARNLTHLEGILE